MNHSRRLLPFLVLISMFGSQEAVAGTSGFPHKASIAAKGAVQGKQVLIGGYSPRCAKGRTFVVKIKVNREDRVARGRTQGPCGGTRVPWERWLKSEVGLGRGVAWVDVVATVKLKAKPISTRHSFRKVKLQKYAPIRGGWSYGDITFDLGRAGAQIKITGGGAGTSNCTRDETVTSFTTNSNPEKHQVAIYAKGDGSCWNERSWSSFKIEVKGANGQTGSGRVTQGEFDGSPPFLGYGLDCRADWYASHKEMEGIKCERTGRYDVKITWP